MRSRLSIGSLTTNPRSETVSSVITPNGQIVATGGTITTGTDAIGDYKIHTFTSNGTFELTESYEGAKFEILIVGAGGSGSSNSQFSFFVPYPYAGGMQTFQRTGQGGGGGGVIYLSNKEVSIGSHNVEVGTSNNATRLDTVLPGLYWEQTGLATGRVVRNYIPEINSITGIDPTSQFLGTKGKPSSFDGFVADGGWGGDSILRGYDIIQAANGTTIPSPRHFTLNNYTSSKKKNNGGSITLPSNIQEDLYYETYTGGQGQVNESHAWDGKNGPSSIDWKLYYDQQLGSPFGFKCSISGTEIEYSAGGESGSSDISSLTAPGSGGHGNSAIGQNGIVIIKYYVNPTSSKIFINGGRITANNNYTFHEFRVPYDVVFDKLPPDEKIDILVSSGNKNSYVIRSSPSVYSSNVKTYTPSISITENQYVKFGDVYHINVPRQQKSGVITGSPGVIQYGLQLRPDADVFFDITTNRKSGANKYPYNFDISGWNVDYLWNSWQLPNDRGYKIPVRIFSLYGRGANVWAKFVPQIQSLVTNPTAHITRGNNDDTVGVVYTGKYIFAGLEILDGGEGYTTDDWWQLDLVQDDVGTYTGYYVGWQGALYVDDYNTIESTAITRNEYSQYVNDKIEMSWSSNTKIGQSANTNLTYSTGYTTEWYDDLLPSTDSFGTSNNSTSNTTITTITNYQQYSNLISNTTLTLDFNGTNRVYGQTDVYNQTHINYIFSNTGYWFGTQTYNISERKTFNKRADTGTVIIRYKSHVDGHKPELLVQPETTISGSQLFSTPGYHYWTCPRDVYDVSVVAIGGGGAGGSNLPGELAEGGQGGSLTWRNKIKVTPGKKYLVKVGAGGLPDGNNLVLSQGWPRASGGGGQKSLFIDDQYVYASGGNGGSGGNRMIKWPSMWTDIDNWPQYLQYRSMYNSGSNTSGQLNSTATVGWIGDGGSIGGTPSPLLTQGRSGLTSYTNTFNPLIKQTGGGGAGGYNNVGQGGYGGPGKQVEPTDVTISYNDRTKPENQFYGNAVPASGGGGTDVYGLGSNGSNGSNQQVGGLGSANTSQTIQGTNGGSPYISLSNHILSSRNNNTWYAGNGGKYGGGGGGNGLGGYDNYYQVIFVAGELIMYTADFGKGSSGGDGAVRIIWGPNRSFPSSNTASP